jgi:predicted HAD superfamily Cof-like phosphohydrolase
MAKILVSRGGARSHLALAWAGDTRQGEESNVFSTLGGIYPRAVVVDSPLDVAEIDVLLSATYQRVWLGSQVMGVDEVTDYVRDVVSVWRQAVSLPTGSLVSVRWTEHGFVLTVEEVLSSEAIAGWGEEALRPAGTAMSNFARLVQFHTAIGVPTPLALSPLPHNEIALRLRLITEEYEEAVLAFDELSREAEGAAKVAHELVDLLYVTYGALARLGVDADAVFAEIHRANMAKTHGPRRGDGKLLKPDGWQPADVGKVLALQKIFGGVS